MRLATARTVGLALVLALCAPRAEAQAWRTVDASRQRQGADSSLLHVQVNFGAGELSLQPADPQLLYHVQLHYDADRIAPLRRFDAAAHSLTIGVDGKRTSHLARVRRELGASHSKAGHRAPNTMTLALARDLPLDLLLNIGAVEAQLDLSHLWLDRLVLHSGASDVKLSFGTPNPHRLRLLEILGGATSIRVTKLGNANASALRVRSGAADVDLDFGGAWAGDMRVDLDAALGDATFRVPPDVGVRVSMHKVLANLDGADLHFTKRGGAYYSDNWADSPHKLTIDAHTILGDVIVRRTQP